MASPRKNGSTTADDDSRRRSVVTTFRRLSHAANSSESVVAGSLSAAAFDELARALLAAKRDDPVAFGLIGTADPHELALWIESGSSLAEDDAKAARLMPEQLDSLEAIVRLHGRPALLVQDADVDIPEDWSMLAAFRADIGRVAASVGRIAIGDSEGNAADDAYVGTGFVAGAGLLMTNNHVAAAFTSRPPSGPQLKALGKVFVDFVAEFGATRRARVEIVGVRCMHSQVDLAVLELAAHGMDGQPVPGPLPLWASTNPPAKGTRCYVVGYPSVDVRQRSHASEAARIFNGINGRKRLAPGCIVQVDPTASLLTHDCSTLGGNSGSCVVDLERNKVVGLHFGGSYLEGNSAVLLSHVDRRSMPGELNFK